MARLRISLAFLFVIANAVQSKIGNETIDTNQNGTHKVFDMDGFKNSIKSEVEDVNARRAAYRSTSSSSGEKKRDERKSNPDTGESLEITDEVSSSDEKVDNKQKKHIPPSSEERPGWRKWHRKCTPCPEEMEMKWRNPRIKWICGAYQQARRSFKSPCMMYYRNCQDGTMFTKIADHRCPDDPGRYGQHFFYDYFAKLTDDSSSSKDKTTSSSSEFRSSD